MSTANEPVAELKFTGRLGSTEARNLIDAMGIILARRNSVRLYLNCPSGGSDRVAGEMLFDWMFTRRERIETVNAKFIGAVGLLPFAAGGTRHCMGDSFFSVSPLLYFFEPLPAMSAADWQSFIHQIKEWDHQFTERLARGFGMNLEQLQTLLAEDRHIDAKEARILGLTTM